MKFNPLSAQTVDYSVHANIIYRFTKYVEWPASSKTGEFVIGFIGDTPLFEYLQTAILNKTVGGQKIIIRKFTGNEAAFNCEILYISEDESGKLKRIVATTKDASILLVTESEGLGNKGTCINFIIEDEHLTLEFNGHNLAERKLKVASELLSLGKMIDENNK